MDLSPLFVRSQQAPSQASFGSHTITGTWVNPASFDDAPASLPRNNLVWQGFSNYKRFENYVHELIHKVTKLSGVIVHGVEVGWAGVDFIC